jgi:hypothetical protein
MLGLIRERKMLLYKGNGPLLQAAFPVGNIQSVGEWRQLTLVFPTCYKNRAKA